MVPGWWRSDETRRNSLCLAICVDGTAVACWDVIRLSNVREHSLAIVIRCAVFDQGSAITLTHGRFQPAEYRKNKRGWVTSRNDKRLESSTSSPRVVSSRSDSQPSYCGRSRTAGRERGNSITSGVESDEGFGMRFVIARGSYDQNGIHSTTRSVPHHTPRSASFLSGEQKDRSVCWSVVRDRLVGASWLNDLGSFRTYKAVAGGTFHAVSPNRGLAVVEVPNQV